MKTLVIGKFGVHNVAAVRADLGNLGKRCSSFSHTKTFLSALFQSNGKPVYAWWTCPGCEMRLAPNLLTACRVTVHSALGQNAFRSSNSPFDLGLSICCFHVLLVFFMNKFNRSTLSVSFNFHEMCRTWFLFVTNGATGFWGTVRERRRVN